MQDRTNQETYQPSCRQLANPSPMSLSNRLTSRFYQVSMQTIDSATANWMLVSVLHLSKSSSMLIPGPAVTSLVLWGRKAAEETKGHQRLLEYAVSFMRWSPLYWNRRNCSRKSKYIPSALYKWTAEYNFLQTHIRRRLNQSMSGRSTWQPQETSSGCWKSQTPKTQPSMKASQNAVLQHGTMGG